MHLHGSRYIGLRSRFYDDYLLGASRECVCQVVILGAGLDTRAYRLAWPPDTAVFEVDQPGVLDFKDLVLRARAVQPSCARRHVGVDLRDDWAAALEAGGFDPTAATAWLAEGLLAYLPAAAEERLLRHIDDLSAPGSHVALDRIVGNLAGDDGARLRELGERSGIDMQQLISTETRANVGSWLAEHSWSVDERSTEDLARRYGRNLGNPFPRGGDTKVGSGNRVEPPWLDTVFVTGRRPT